MTSHPTPGQRERIGLPHLVLAAIVLSVPLRYGDLSRPTLCSGDEALTAVRTVGLIEQGHGWTPYWNGEVNLHKPPLYYWMVAAGFGLLGEGELAVRLPSVLSYLALILLVYGLTRRLMDAWAGCLAALLVAVNPVLFEQSRMGMMDTLVILLYLAGGWCLWRAAQAPRWYLGWGAAAALALLTKGLGAGLLVPVSLVYLAVARPRAFADRRLYAGLGVAAALAGIWFGSQAVLNPAHFMREYVQHEVAGRVRYNAWVRLLDQTSTKRLWQAWGALAPIVFASPLLLCLLRPPGGDRDRDLTTGWRAWLFPYLLLLALLVGTNMLQRQKYWYVVPLIPLTAMTTACVVRAAAARAGRGTAWTVLAILSSGVLLAPCLAHAPRARLALFALVATAWCLALLWRRGGPGWAAAVIGVFLALSATGLSARNRHVNIAQVQDSASLARLAAVIRTRHDDTGPVITNFRYYPANVVKFYARRQTQEWRYFVRDAMPPGARRYAIVHGDAAAGFRNIEVAHLTSDGDYDLLLLRNTGPAPVRPASAGPAPAHTGNGAEKSGYP